MRSFPTTPISAKVESHNKRSFGSKSYRLAIDFPVIGMAPALSILAAELQLQIANHLGTDRKSLKHWSCASKHFRSLLAPRVFKSVTLMNTDESGLFVKQYGQYIKELHFRGFNYAARTAEDILPSTVESILTNLSQFPKLESVYIAFLIDFDTTRFQGDFYQFQDPESDEEVVEAEANESWRRLMAGTFAALAKNTDPGFRSLILENLLPKKVSTFSSPVFHALLGKMQRFEMSVYGADNGACWKINGLEGYTHFTQNLGTWFFDHLSSVTDLTIHGHQDGRLGGRYDDLRLNATHLPAVKKLHLTHAYLCPGLQQFLVGHAQTLEVLEMDNCHAYDEDSQVFWDSIFVSLAEAKPSKLRSLKIVPENLPLEDEDFERDRMYMNEPVSDEVVEARRILRKSPGKRLFAYCYIDTKYSSMYEDLEENLARFQMGEDQRAYDELMLIIDDNKSKD